MANRRTRSWSLGFLALVTGGVVALLPFVLLVVIQGTATEAWTAATAKAAHRLMRATAWPGGWADVMPLWVPLAWTVLGLIFWCRRAWGSRTSETDAAADLLPRSPGPAEVSFLLIWLALACCAAALMFRYQRLFRREVKLAKEEGTLVNIEDARGDWREIIGQVRALGDAIHRQLCGKCKKAFSKGYNGGLKKLADDMA